MKKINNYLKRLEKSGSLSTEQYKKIKAVGSRPGILYGLCKVHKAITEVCPPFRPILSAIGTPSYKLAKFLVPKLSSVTFNESTVKDSFAFAEEIVHQNIKLFMGSLDVDSLSTNTPLEETINICTNLLYNNEDVIEGINKFEFKNLLSLATQESHFIFNEVGKRMAWPWDRLLDLLWQMFSCDFMKSNGLNSVLRNLNQFLTEDMLMTFLFSSNRLNTSRNFVIILILVIQTCLFPLNKKKMESYHFLM